MYIAKESHLDHGLTEAQVAWIAKRFEDRTAFFIESGPLPEELGTVLCGLYGPLMGDEPVLESEVVYRMRGDRPGASRMVSRPSRPSRIVTVIAGPFNSEPCVLYTAFGGPTAPREPWDVSLSEDEKAASERFWSEHALAVE